MSKFNGSDIVYYIENYRDGISFGLLDEEFASEISLCPLYIYKECYINGDKATDMNIPSRWRKLPKGWSYDTELIKVEYRTRLQDADGIDITSSESLADAVERGILVTAPGMRDGSYTTEVGKLGWRIVHDMTSARSYRWVLTLPKRMVFKTYKDASIVLERYNKELEKQANMSDEQFYTDRLRRTLYHGIEMEMFSKEEAENYLRRLVKMGNIDMLDVRLTTAGLEYKYEKQKRWSVLA